MADCSSRCGIKEASREAAFEDVRAEFTRNGFNVPEGLIAMLDNFSLKFGETAENGRARLYRLLWTKLWFGSEQTLGAHVGAKPTYVFPSTLKRVVREIIPGNLVDQEDPTHPRVYKVNIADLSAAKWPPVTREKNKPTNKPSNKRH